ncbi:unnamed protein product [Effrenium voratum]|nr:unnamed protein product [Effrenium voratum]
MQTLHPFFVGVERLVRLGVSETVACEILKEVKGSGKTAQRLDWRSAALPAPVYSVTKDRDTSRWSSSLRSLFFGFGGLSPVRLPLYNIVFVFDPAEVEELKTAVQLLNQMPLPAKMHFVMVAPSRAQTNAWDEEVLGVKPSWLSGRIGRFADRVRLEALCHSGRFFGRSPLDAESFAWSITVVKINLFDTDDGRFAISTDDISERESELLKEQQKEAEVQKEEITQRNKAYMFLKQHKNDLNHAVCQAASDYFDFETLTQLVKMGGSVNKQVCGVDSGTPLHQMVFWGLHAGVTRLVRELGADPNLGDARGLPPLFAACAQLHELSNMETVRALVEGGADVNMEVEGWPLIELAAQRRQWQVTKCLLEAGASWPWSFASAEFKLGDKTYTMPLAQPSLEDSNYKFCKAAETNDAVQVISYLVAGKDIDFGLCWTPALEWYTTALGHAAFHQQKDMVKLLKEAGASQDQAKSCSAQQKLCPTFGCFRCLGACEAYHSQDAPMAKKPSRSEKDPHWEIPKMLSC